MGIPAGSIGGMAGAAAASSVYKEVLGRCLKDENDNPYTTCSRIFSIAMKALVIIFGIAAAILIACLIFSPESREPGEVATTIGLIIGGSIIMILFHFIIRAKFSGTYTLLPEGLKVDTPSVKETFSYSDIQAWAEKYPPIEYAYFYIFVVNNKMIKLNFSSLMGSLDFITLLCYQANIPVPDTDAMAAKISKGLASATKEQKAAYAAYKNLHN